MGRSSVSRVMSCVLWKYRILWAVLAVSRGRPVKLCRIPTRVTMGPSHQNPPVTSPIPLLILGWYRTLMIFQILVPHPFPPHPAQPTSQVCNSVCWGVIFGVVYYVGVNESVTSLKPSTFACLFRWRNALYSPLWLWCPYGGWPELPERREVPYYQQYVSWKRDS